MAITSFRGKYFFLSNYYNCRFIFDGIRYSTAEAAFQAQKTFTYEEKLKMSKMAPGESKKYIRTIPNRKDWYNVSIDMMYEVVKAKFDQNPRLKGLLLDTEDEELIEGNTWNDTFWGVYRGEGENHLGKTLMRIRDEYR